MIDIITYNDKTVQALYDALLYNSIQSNGIITGMQVDILATGSSIPISDGFGIVEGRVFQVSGETVDVNLTPGETTQGQIILKIDLSNTDEPISIFSDNTMRPLVQNSNFNIMEGTWEEQIATYTVDTTSVSNIEQTFKSVASINDVKVKTDFVQSTLTEAIQSEAGQREQDVQNITTTLNDRTTSTQVSITSNMSGVTINTNLSRAYNHYRTCFFNITFTPSAEIPAYQTTDSILKGFPAPLHEQNFIAFSRGNSTSTCYPVYISTRGLMKCRVKIPANTQVIVYGFYRV